MGAPVGRVERYGNAFRKEGGPETTVTVAGAAVAARRVDPRLVPLITAIAVGALIVFIINVARYNKYTTIYKLEEFVYSKIGKNTAVLAVVLLFASLFYHRSPAVSTFLGGVVGGAGGTVYDRRSLGVDA